MTRKDLNKFNFMIFHNFWRFFQKSVKIAKIAKFSLKPVVDNQLIRKFNQTDQIDQTDQTKGCGFML